MSKQYPTSYESVRSAVVAFMRSCDPYMQKLYDRQLLKAGITRMQGGPGALSTGLKNTGIKRPADDLGRVVIPKELRNTLGWEQGTPIEFFIDDNGAIFLQKYAMTECAICGHDDQLTKIKRKYLCEDCISKVFEGEG